MTEESHEQQAANTVVRCAVITVSDTRTVDTDVSGSMIEIDVAEAGHDVVTRQIVPDDPRRIVQMMEVLARHTDVVVFNGGTGISKRDSTFEAISGQLDKTLPGFGEVFRAISYEDIGPRAVLSRATAGVYRDTVVFSIPGSPAAVRLALDALIVPLMQHAVWEILRQKE